MLKRLFLKNFILIESCSIEFSAGLTVITGESGSGKTALVHALSLILGDKSDDSTIRHGEQKAIIEAAFDLPPNSPLFSLLDECGVETDKSELLVIRRELHRNAKGRSLINNQIASLSLVQKIGALLLETISQHANHLLRKESSQRRLLDLFGETSTELSAFQAAWNQQLIYEKESCDLQQFRQQLEEKASYFEEMTQEIDEANLSEEEETLLVAEYNRRSHATGLIDKTSAILSELSDTSNPLLHRLAQVKKQTISLSAQDAALHPAAELLETAFIHLKEAEQQLLSYLDQLESDPKRVDYLRQRIEVIDKLKRKHGNSFAQIQETYKSAKESLLRLQNLEEEQQLLQKKLTENQQLCSALCNKLSAKRKTKAVELSQLITEKLHFLHMKGARFTVEVNSCERTLFGEDQIQFWLQANVGEQAAAVASHSSGGELSRLLLAIRTLLAEKNETGTILFDEIDANVGGETATKIAHALQELARHRQVLCITHFPQVARYGDHHLRVHKEESAGRTFATIANLTDGQRSTELLRMLGGKTPQSNSSLYRS